MINNAPAQFLMTAFSPAYTKCLIAHNVPTDMDVVGIAVYRDTEGVKSHSVIPHSVGSTLLLLENVEPNTTAEFAFYDEITNHPSLLAIGFGINKSDTIPLTMLAPPAVESVTATSEQTDVGVIPAEFVVNMTGDATSVIIQIKKVGELEWQSKYVGPFSPSVNLGTIGDGSYNVRVKGTITLIDGTTEQDPEWQEFPDVVDTTTASTSPDPVSNIVYTAMKKTTPADTYDLKASWSWERGTGGGLKAFRVKWRPNGSSGEWAESTVTGTSIILSTIPYDVLYDLVIESIPFGNTAISSTSSTFKIHDDPVSRVPPSMTFSDFSKDTDIQIGYRYIKAFHGSGVNRELTFLLDAENGNMAIGKAHADYGGIAPITVDGTTGTMAINGRIITDKIYAATYEMSWIDGAASQPQFRTANKLSYDDDSDGIWMGYDAANSFKMAIGNNQSFIKYSTSDGKLQISANVEILGAGALGSYYETRYLTSDTIPPTPDPAARNPVGWTLDPVEPTEGQKIYQTRARINADETVLEAWSAPKEAVLGANGKSAFEIWKEQPGNENKTMEDYLASMEGGSVMGTFRWGVPGFTSWNITDANNAMIAIRGAADKAIEGDVLTIFNTSDITIAETRLYNGTSWVDPGLVIHGDMIATGTIRAEKIIANNAQFSAAGIDVIYNTGGDAGNYTMKIDLANGEIHIK